MTTRRRLHSHKEAVKDSGGFGSDHFDPRRKIRVGDIIPSAKVPSGACFWEEDEPFPKPSYQHTTDGKVFEIGVHEGVLNLTGEIVEISQDTRIRILALRDYDLEYEAGYERTHLYTS